MHDWYFRLLRFEHGRSCWGCLLVYRDEFKQFYNGGLCLDIGCNVGFLEGLVGQDNYVGLDIVEYDKRPEHFVKADACGGLPFVDEYFDFVCMIETLEHLYDPYCALLEVKRVLKDKGRLFIQSVDGTDPCAENDPTHLQAFKDWSLQRLLKWVFPDSALLLVDRKGGNILAMVIK